MSLSDPGGRALAVVALVAGIAGGLTLLSDGYARARRQARGDVGALADFRGPYFGALDLAKGADPYPVSPPTERPSDRHARRFGIERMRTLYSPPVLAAYMPLAPLGFLPARVLFLQASFLAVLASIPLLGKLAGLRSAAGLAAACWLVAGFDAVRANLLLGQVNALLLFALAVAGVLLAKRRPAWAGVVLAAVAWCKPNLAVVLVGLAVARCARAPLAALAVSLPMALASVAWFGWDVHVSFFEAALTVAREGAHEQRSLSLQSLWLRLLTPRIDNDGVPLVLAADRVGPLWIASSLAVGGAALLASWRRPTVPASLTLALWVLVALLVAPRSHHHDAVWALVPVAVLVGHASRAASWPFVLVLAASYALIAFPLGTLLVQLEILGLPMALARSAPCLALLALTGCALAAHRTGDGSARARSDGEGRQHVESSR